MYGILTFKTKIEGRMSIVDFKIPINFFQTDDHLTLYQDTYDITLPIYTIV